MKSYRGNASRSFVLVTLVVVLASCTSNGPARSAADPEGSPAVAASIAGTASIASAPSTSMSVARAGHSATRLPDGRVLIVGGFDDDGGVASSAELFDPQTRVFSPTGSMSVPRQSHTATLLRDGRVLIVGGYDEDGRRHATAELYDPETGAFSPTGSMPSARGDHTATLLRSGRVLIVGGSGPGYTFLASALEYDPRTGTFGRTGSMTVPRDSATATLLLDGRVLIAGGHVGRHENIRIHASAEVYEPAARRFTRVGDMTIPRHKHDAVRLQDGQVLIVGGSDDRDDAGLYRSTELFDPATGTFQAAGRMHDGRYKLRGTSVRLADGRVVVCCGGAHAELFDPASGSFRRLAASVGTGPLGGVAALIGPHQVLVTGGYSLSGPATDASWIIRA